MLTAERFKLIPSVYVFLTRGDAILLLRRFQTSYEDGKYGLVAGHADGRETMRQAMVREAREEAGITIREDDLALALTMHRWCGDHERIDLFFTVNKLEGEPYNAEPHKCDDATWFPLTQLPENMVPYIRIAIDCYTRGVRYCEFGWNNKVMIKTIQNPDINRLAQEAVEVFVRHVNELLKQQDHVVVALPGGRSVREFFAVLKNKDFDWQKVHFFMLDERLVSLADEDSNYKAVKEQLFDYLVNNKNLLSGNIHPFHYDALAVDFGLSVYEEELKNFGGKYDIVIAGVGEDGHTGSLFPNHAALDKNQNFVLENNAPKPPSGRMSASPSLIKRAQVAFVFFIGEEKIEAWQKFNDESVDWCECPVKILQEVQELYVITNLKSTKS